MITRSYSELITLDTFLERFEYLKLKGKIGEESFGAERYLNQRFYNSLEWKSFRRDIIIRDNACDLGVEGHDFVSGLVIHHINPITISDIINMSQALLDPENVITTYEATHRAIHYGSEDLLEFPYLPFEFKERFPNDTCPWKG